MSRTARVDVEVYRHLLAHKAQVEAETGRVATMSDAVRHVITEARQRATATLQSWTHDELVGECRDWGLMVVGKKDLLVERLVDAGWLP